MKQMKLRKILNIVLIVLLLVCNFTDAVFAETASVDTLSITTNGNGGKTDIGMWYVINNGVEEWENNSGTGKAIDYRSLLHDGSYGIPVSSDSDLIDFHLKSLSEAKVDFILLDLTETNLAYLSEDSNIFKNAVLTCERIGIWNKNNSWKIRYAFAIGVFSNEEGESQIGESAEAQAKVVYEKFYNILSHGRDNYYQLEKMPLLVACEAAYNPIDCEGGISSYTGERTYLDKFTLKSAYSGGEGSFGYYNKKGVIINPETELVFAGYNSHSLQAAELSRNNGETYKNNWEKVLSNNSPRILMISSFNDYYYDTAVFVTDTSACDGVYEERWTVQDDELDNFLYWSLTKENILRLRLKNADPFVNTFQNGEENTENSGSDSSDFQQNTENTENNPQDEKNNVKNDKKVKIILVIILIFCGFGAIIIYAKVIKREKKPFLDEENVQGVE